jgi:hypothetical protein
MKTSKTYHPVRLFTFISRGMIILGLLILSREIVYSQTVSGNIIVNIPDPNSATMQPAPVVDIASTLQFRASNRRIRKVTVGATYINKHYSLFVQAVNVPAGHGIAQLPVDLMTITTATDFIRDIPIGSGTATCNLQYTAIATYADGNTTENGPGNTVVRVTYTYANQ